MADYKVEASPAISKHHIGHWHSCVTLSGEKNELPIITTFDLSSNTESLELDLHWQNISIPDPDLQLQIDIHKIGSEISIFPTPVLNQYWNSSPLFLLNGIENKGK